MSMRVRVLCPSYCDYTFIDSSGHMDLPADAKLSDLLDRLQLSFFMRRILVVHVNGVKASERTVLHDGDLVSVLSGIYGG